MFSHHFYLIYYPHLKIISLQFIEGLVSYNVDKERSLLVEWLRVRLIKDLGSSQNPTSRLFKLVQSFKVRLLYILNNWCYTTNHRRIAVNYFYFVIFSGIVGAVLATIIRLEMAYPGVGILAGDSLQYLTVVTAHAVVMVFFMIMPLLFGAFANFLLPTQLGVHDVAFPRLNSAAFWFLPAGFIMLSQMVCIDRRYQRMNCFNVREIQTLVRARYHPGKVEAKVTNEFIAELLLLLRHRFGDIDCIETTKALYSQFGIFDGKLNSETLFYFHLESGHQSSAVRYFLIFQHKLYNFIAACIWDWNHLWDWANLTVVFPMGPLFEQKVSNRKPILKAKYNEPDFWVWDLIDDLYWGTFFHSIGGIWSELKLIVGDYSLISYYHLICFTVSEWLTTLRFLMILWFNQSIQECLVSYNIFVAYSLEPSLLLNSYLHGGLVRSFLLLTWGSDSLLCGRDWWLNNILNRFTLVNRFELFSVSKSWSSFSLTQEVLFSGKESTSDTRRFRSSTPVVGYNFKVGDFYPSITIKLYPSIFRSISDLTRGVRRPTWFFSPSFRLLWKANFGNYMNKVVRKSIYSVSPVAVRPTTISNNASFYNFFYLISNSKRFINNRWLSVNTLDQKFYRMFMSSTMQQRIYTNWRHLKFTREAWRCRLLASRHQKTLYKRFTKEESLVWSVEKNAKDVLPGWAMITPFSGRVRYTAIGKVDLGLMGVFLVLNSSIVSSANFLVTYRYLSTLNNRKMRDARSFFTEGVMVASWMMIAANPMLAIGILMLLADRHWQTCFFDYSGGGDTVLFQHMFWFFGHPEVYVIMIPAFGFNNTMLSFYLRKRVSARASLMYSMYTIAFLGFFVWGHHMYMVGLAHTTRMLFSTLTVMISVPAATKLMHWCVTLVNSSFWVEVPFVCSLFFIFFFVSGGISGMAVAHTGMDVLFHDSFYVIGHFHVMFAAAAMIASFGAFYFYFPSIFGLKFSRIWAYLHITYFVLGQMMTVVPMLWLGYSGMPRRILDYPASLGGWHAIISAGHLLSIAGLTAFFVMIFDSMRQGRPAVRNTFGVSRFNTRFAFYLYESTRILHIQHKGYYLSRLPRFSRRVTRHLIVHLNKELLELNNFSFCFVQSSTKPDKGVVESVVKSEEVKERLPKGI